MKNESFENRMMTMFTDMCCSYIVQFCTYLRKLTSLGVTNLVPEKKFSEIENSLTNYDDTILSSDKRIYYKCNFQAYARNSEFARVSWRKTMKKWCLDKNAFGEVRSQLSVLLHFDCIFRSRFLDTNSHYRENKTEQSFPSAANWKSSHQLIATLSDATASLQNEFF